MAATDATFPPGFVWGAATSAYQIEGSVRVNGRGASIWDTFTHTPGTIANGDTGDIAADHYRRWPEDVALMRELGLGGYRFSIAWPRIFPDGAGRPNEAGIDHYRRLVDALHAAGIEPYVTLFHWDLPQALQDTGGWTNRDTAARFGEYAYLVARALGSGVHHWVTVNELWVAAVLGHLHGVHAPGIRSAPAALAALHHLLLAHGIGLEALRAEMAPDDDAGIAFLLSPVEPAGDGAADAEAAERYDAFLNRSVLDPIFRGTYPPALLEFAGDAMPEVRPDDLVRISAPIDVLGVNYYSPVRVRHDPEVPFVQALQVTPEGVPTTALGWEVRPSGLSDILERVQRDYAPSAVIVMENGAAYVDRLVDGAVDDGQRERFLHDHVLAAYRAIESGVPLRGYFVWSLIDNFEWNEGFGPRFGLVYLDHATQARTIKRSGRWFAEVTRENGVRG